MLIKNIHIENNPNPIDLRILNGKFHTISHNIEQEPNEEVIDGTNCMILPPFVESHVHLDTCLTAGDPVWNMSGTLFEGIECWSKRKEQLNKEDVKQRAFNAASVLLPAPPSLHRAQAEEGGRVRGLRGRTGFFLRRTDEKPHLHLHGLLRREALPFLLPVLLR